MDRDDILRMAREAGFNPQSQYLKSKLEKLAALVRAAALEEAAKVCEAAAEAFEVFCEPQKARACATCAADIRAADIRDEKEQQ